MTAPPGIRETARSKAATAGAAVVIPAAMVKPGGGLPVQRRAVARSRRLRRSVRSIAPRRASSAGQAEMIACRRSSDFCQWPARSSVAATASASFDAGTSSIVSASSVRARSAARRIASAALSPPRRTIAASANWRASGSIAGGTRSSPSATSSAPPMRSSRSGSPMAINRGRIRPLPLARTKASVTLRMARLLGSRMRPPASAIGSRP